MRNSFDTDTILIIFSLFSLFIICGMMWGFTSCFWWVTIPFAVIIIVIIIPCILVYLEQKM